MLHSLLRPAFGHRARTADGSVRAGLHVVVALVILLLPGPALPTLPTLPTPPALPALPALPAAVHLPAAADMWTPSDAGEPRARSTFVPEWSWPLDPLPAVLRHFEKPPQKWKPGHRGVDLSVAGVGSAVLSPADGVVSFAGTVVDRGVLSIDHGDGRVSSFEPVTTTLSKGQPVARGDVVATLSAPRAIGSPGGHCGRPCLHWGVRVAGDYVDPLSFVLDRRPSVLLPLRE